MPYEFAETSSSSSRPPLPRVPAVPPRKNTGIGVLDPPVPPKRPPGPIPATRSSLFLRILGAMILAALVAGILFLLFAPR